MEWSCLLSQLVADTRVCLQQIEGVPKLTEGLNPATWVLQISTPGMERGIGVDFAEVFERSQTTRYSL